MHGFLTAGAAEGGLFLLVTAFGTDESHASHPRAQARIPPTKKAVAKEPNQIATLSFQDRSLKIIITEAMQGTNRVIVTRETRV